ncbi:MAG: FeoA domain-containing protein [Candidatus Sericytochromatia bacterium]|nr:FeoA domain-containing protein [Candidatus Sericytochromatia bacterium]
MLVGTGPLTRTMAANAPQSIAAFSEGACVQIRALSGDRQLCLRLESMGLAVGKEVQVLKNSGRGLLLKTEFTRLAIRLSPAFMLQAVYAGHA